MIYETDDSRRIIDIVHVRRRREAYR
ncbi:MAG: hypothetical protein ACE15C_06225 [Phycisphaerae bacterium]